MNTVKRIVATRSKKTNVEIKICDGRLTVKVDVSARQAWVTLIALATAAKSPALVEVASRLLHSP